MLTGILRSSAKQVGRSVASRKVTVVRSYTSYNAAVAGLTAEQEEVGLNLSNPSLIPVPSSSLLIR
jgi:hypothetical protein